MQGVWAVASYALNGKSLNIAGATAAITGNKLIAHFPNSDEHNRFRSLLFTIKGDDIDGAGV